MADNFELTDKGVLNYFLGIAITREGEIKLNQEKYINDLLKQHNMENCKAVLTPLDPGYNGKCNNDCEKLDAEKYQSVIGALSFLAVTSRPDIQHSVSKLAQHNKEPHAEHTVAVKNILRYLRGTAEVGLKYEKSTNTVCGYVDSDWGVIQ